MKKIMLLLIALIVCAAPLVSLAERSALSRQEAVALMDAMSETYCLDDADFRAVQRENEQHTREWEKKYGYHIRWDGDMMADYVLAYGMMPTYDAPYASAPDRKRCTACRLRDRWRDEKRRTCRRKPPGRPWCCRR